MSARWRPIRSDGADSRSPNSKRRPPNATCLPPELSKLKSATANNPQCEYARKLFLFSYYCYGISFIDMAMLTAAHIKQMEDGDYIVYKRQKIKRQKGVKPISIKITPAIRQLIESLQAASPTVDDFLLPVVTRSGYTGERLYMHIRTRYSKYQKYLRLLAEELGIDFHLTSYVSAIRRP
ncbi:MAG: hypothetical protein ACLUQ6_06955 [Alistipes onderdonkii]